MIGKVKNYHDITFIISRHLERKHPIVLSADTHDMTLATVATTSATAFGVSFTKHIQQTESNPEL